MKLIMAQRINWTCVELTLSTLVEAQSPEAFGGLGEALLRKSEAFEESLPLLRRGPLVEEPDLVAVVVVNV